MWSVSFVVPLLPSFRACGAMQNTSFNKIKNARNGRDLLGFKPEVIKYERSKLKDIFWIKCGLRNLKSF